MLIVFTPLALLLSRLKWQAQTRYGVHPHFLRYMQHFLLKHLDGKTWPTSQDSKRITGTWCRTNLYGDDIYRDALQST